MDEDELISEAGHILCPFTPQIKPQLVCFHHSPPMKITYRTPVKP